MKTFFLLVPILSCLSHLSYGSGRTCRLTDDEYKAVNEEVTLYLEALVNGAPAVLGITYFLFAILGFMIAVWHVNKKLAFSDGAGLPYEDHDIARRYTMYKKALAVKKGMPSKSSPEPLQSPMPSPVPPPLLPGETPKERFIRLAHERERNVLNYPKTPIREGECNYQIHPLWDAKKEPTPSEIVRENEEKKKDKPNVRNYELKAFMRQVPPDQRRLKDFKEDPKSPKLRDCELKALNEVNPKLPKERRLMDNKEDPPSRLRDVREDPPPPRASPVPVLRLKNTPKAVPPPPLPPPPEDPPAAPEVLVSPPKKTPPKVPPKPIESLDTIKQAIARDKLEEEHRIAMEKDGASTNDTAGDGHKKSAPGGPPPEDVTKQ